MQIRWWVSLVILVVAPLSARAEHALIDLRVFRGEQEPARTEDEARASSDHDPPEGGINPRPLFKAKANEPLVLQFVLINEYPHGEKKDVVVRYFIVREEKARQKHVPDPKSGAVVKGKFTMNFKPKCKVGARLNFSIKEKGFYLLRVETQHTDSDHEHFSAIDIQVE